MSDNVRRQAGKHMIPITRLIQACGFNQEALLDTLQNYVEGQCAIAFEAGKSATVESVCMSLHSGPPEMVCGSCINAERTVGSMIQVQAEIDNARREPEK